MYSSLRKPAAGLSVNRIGRIVSYVSAKEKKTGALSVHLVGERRMKTLNREYRGKDAVTDVLSFALPEETAPFSPSGVEHDWGDMFVCVAQLRRQAKKYGVSFKEEATRMVVHGTLHLFGYDHMRSKDAKVMLPLQETYVEELL